MNTELRKKAKNDFEKDFFKLMNNAVFGKTMENVKKHRYIKLVTTDKRRNQLVTEPNYYAIKCFSENLLAIEMKKTKVKMNKPIYLGLSILEISKILMYKFWYDYMKPKYGDNMDTNSFIMNIKTEDFYKDIANDVEKRFDTSNYEVDRPLPAGKNKKVIDNDNHRISTRRYNLPTVEIKDYNIMINGENFFDQPIKNNKVTYENIRKIATGQGDDYTTGCLLDYPYFMDTYKMIAVDLSKQQALDADPRAIQQINFTENLDRTGNTRFYFIIEEAKETILDFLQGTVKVL